MINFLLMGGYAVYVWPAVALTLAVLGLNVLWARRALASAQRDAGRRLTQMRRQPT